MAKLEQLTRGDDGQCCDQCAAPATEYASSRPRSGWLAKVDAALAVLHRTVRQATEYQGDTYLLGKQIVMLGQARMAEVKGNSEAADSLLQRALNGSNEAD